MAGRTVELQNTVESDRSYEYFDVRIANRYTTGVNAPGELPMYERGYVSERESIHRLYRDVETGLVVSNIRAFEKWIKEGGNNEY